MLQLDNSTPFEAELSVLNDESGVDTLYVIVKATFEDRGGWTVSDDPHEVWQGDTYYGEPGASSLRYPSEQHLGKMATDVLVEGSAWGREAKAVCRQPVSVAVGSLSQELAVFGDRVWRRGGISLPEPFVSMPIRYEHAYGGSVQRDGRWIVYDERNPVGRFAVGRFSAEDVEEEPLPNIEHPQALLQSVSDNPEPVGVGAVAPSWLPRTRHAGTYDQQWRQTRAPFAPEDFSRRFFNVSAPGLMYPGWMEGGEPFSLEGMHPEGAWQGQVPKVNLSVKAARGGDVSALEPRLETLFLEPEQRRLAMTWRAQIQCPKKVLDVESVHVALGRTSW
ncbi:DUF2169 family type VI secretion system accessory protein [Marinimicrobium locisalis]|uniref:DUF2169 family type VI secretion system accessory protein n=1 Tax=Marinimicrobium locisalis TaxID=546022 RepID=UPI0032220C21